MKNKGKAQTKTVLKGKPSCDRISQKKNHKQEGPLYGYSKEDNHRCREDDGSEEDDDRRSEEARRGNGEEGHHRRREEAGDDGKEDNYRRREKTCGNGKEDNDRCRKEDDHSCSKEACGNSEEDDCRCRKEAGDNSEEDRRSSREETCVHDKEACCDSEKAGGSSYGQHLYESDRDGEKDRGSIPCRYRGPEEDSPEAAEGRVFRGSPEAAGHGRRRPGSRR